MPDLAAIKYLDGHQAVFCRFDGADKICPIPQTVNLSVNGAV
jgi:hypothetical protein